MTEPTKIQGTANLEWEYHFGNLAEPKKMDLFIRALDEALRVYQKGIVSTGNNLKCLALTEKNGDYVVLLRTKVQGGAKRHCLRLNNKGFPLHPRFRAIPPLSSYDIPGIEVKRPPKADKYTLGLANDPETKLVLGEPAKYDPFRAFRELKAKAKKLGIDTKGMKKADIEKALVGVLKKTETRLAKAAMKAYADRFYDNAIEAARKGD